MAIVEVLIPGLPGPGLPSGGSVGQVPRKKSAADYDTEWVDPSQVGLPQGLAVTDSPTFSGLTLSGLSTNRLVFTGVSGVLGGLGIGNGLAIVNGSLVVTAGGSGTVTSVGLTVPQGFAVNGSPVTTSGTLALSFAAGYSLPLTSSQASWDAAAALAATAVQPAALTSALSSKADLTDARFTDAREWSAATVTQAEAEAGTSTSRMAFTAQRIFQAVAAWWEASAAAIKLAGIASGATANATDAQLRDRSTHTGTQTASTISGLAAVATSGLYGDLSGRPTLGTAAPLDVAAAGDASASQVVKGGDSRLSDARTPTAHTQTASTISDSTTAGRALLTAADAAAQRSSLGLGTAATGAASSAAPQDPAATAAAGSSSDLARADHVHRFQPTDLLIPLSDESTALTVSTRLTISYWPRATVLTAIPIWMVGTAPTGAALQLDIRIGGTSIFSTLPTIAAGGTNSTTTTAAVFSSAFVSGGQTIAAGSSVTFHVLQIGSTVAGACLKVSLPSRRGS